MTPATGASAPAPSRVRVWDRVVRLAHWLLVCAVLAAWFTGHRPGRLHEVLGYAAAAIVVVRLAWGWLGGPYARFAQFVHGPRVTWDYTRRVMAGDEPRYLGHNPLGGWMVVALIACVAAVAATGALYVTDRFWGYAWLEALHAGLAWLLVLLVPVHVAGVVFTSMRHRENLLLAMLTGDKRRPGEGDR